MVQIQTSPVFFFVERLLPVTFSSVDTSTYLADARVALRSLPDAKRIIWDGDTCVVEISDAHYCLITPDVDREPGLAGIIPTSPDWEVGFESAGLAVVRHFTLG